MYPLWIVPIAILVAAGTAVCAQSATARIRAVLVREQCHGVPEMVVVSHIRIPVSLLVVFVASTTYLILMEHGVTGNGVLLVTASILLWTMAYVDGQTAILPDLMTGSLLWVALAWQVQHQPEHLPSVALCIVTLLTFALPFLINWVYRRFRGVQAIGIGDAKLAAGMVLFFGSVAMGWILLKAMSLCLLYTVGRLVVGKKMPRALPLGPFFALSGNLWMLTHV